MIVSVFGDDAPQALKIAKCESGFDNDVVIVDTNAHVSVGTFQINGVHGHDTEWLQEPWNNIKIAKQLFDKNGWRDWRNCAKKYNLLGKP